MEGVVRTPQRGARSVANGGLAIHCATTHAAGVSEVHHLLAKALLNSSEKHLANGSAVVLNGQVATLHHTSCGELRPHVDQFNALPVKAHVFVDGMQTDFVLLQGVRRNGEALLCGRTLLNASLLARHQGTHRKLGQRHRACVHVRRIIRVALIGVLIGARTLHVGGGYNATTGFAANLA
eukprot:6216272-Prymnesium_polylepis.2